MGALQQLSMSSREITMTVMLIRVLEWLYRLEP